MKNPGYYDWGKYTAENSFNKAGYFNGLEGTLNMPVPNLKENIKIYHAAGQSVEVHTNGSAAAEPTWRLLEEAVAASPNVTDTRHTSIHGQTMERSMSNASLVTMKTLKRPLICMLMLSLTARSRTERLT